MKSNLHNSLKLDFNDPPQVSDRQQVLCKANIPARLFSKIRIKRNGCWQWIGSIGFHPKYRYHRYGQLKYWSENLQKRVSTSAHRFIYQCSHGLVPKNWDVDHLCQNKLCVNPKHLQAIPHQTNIQLRYSRQAVAR